MGTVEHNGVMGLDAEVHPSGQAQPKGPAANMANDLLIQPESETEAALALPAGHELDAFLGRAFEEKSLWTSLYESVRDFFFPPICLRWS